MTVYLILFRQPVVNYSSPSHPIHYPSERNQIDDFSAPVGSTRVEMAPFSQESMFYVENVICFNLNSEFQSRLKRLVIDN